MAESTDDVPSPIDLRLMADARTWADEAMVKRPWRTAFFEAYAAAIAGRPGRRVLELGSGPGFLAAHLLQALPAIELVALDFSPAMHALAKERLGARAQGVRFVERSFLSSDWTAGLGPFDAAVTLQAVHELRHKRRAAALHAQVRDVLVPGGMYLVADHAVGEPGGPANDRLFMTVVEQKAALRDAGFGTVELLRVERGLVLLQARAD